MALLAGVRNWAKVVLPESLSLLRERSFIHAQMTLTGVITSLPKMGIQPTFGFFGRHIRQVEPAMGSRHEQGSD